MFLAVQTGNRLLDGLEAVELEALAPRLGRVKLKLHDVICVPGERFTDVYFPVNGVLSTTIVTDEGDEVEIATVGLEGFDPVVVLLGADRSAYRTVCQVAGESYRLPVDVFMESLQRFASLRTRSHRFAQAFLQFMSQSIACNRLHPLIERAARWLLITHDRVRGDDVRLTQEYLAVMLGVRRPAVNVAARTLQEAGVIRYRRGSISVLDREGLEAASCECYATVKAAYERLLALP
ncbi:MAG: Crp/Fnr family transcriptional regulator [Candidatus Eremiobacteraeota bacterium]|nr:Crp/Fnr family transcriptional regulator [Candidatus Eremiobacteraeota bacterium]